MISGTVETPPNEPVLGGVPRLLIHMINLAASISWASHPPEFLIIWEASEYHTTLGPHVSRLATWFQVAGAYKFDQIDFGA